MEHRADSPDAHRRHWEDAELLLAQGRLANADHLYGFSAECGLKAVGQSLGMPLRKKHVQELWPICAAYFQGKLGRRYLQLLPAGTPFTDWHHNNRYAHRGHVTGANVSPHHQAARAIRTMVQSMAQDGQL